MTVDISLFPLTPLIFSQERLGAAMAAQSSLLSVQCLDYCYYPLRFGVVHQPFASPTPHLRASEAGYYQAQTMTFSLCDPPNGIDLAVS